MTNLIIGKEAKMAWGSGEMVEYYKKDRDEWFEIRGNTYVTVFDVMDRFRIKPRTSTIKFLHLLSRKTTNPCGLWIQQHLLDTGIFFITEVVFISCVGAPKMKLSK